MLFFDYMQISTKHFIDGSTYYVDVGFASPKTRERRSFHMRGKIITNDQSLSDWEWACEVLKQRGPYLLPHDVKTGAGIASPWGGRAIEVYRP